jgi:hypothetical protein
VIEDFPQHIYQQFGSTLDGLITDLGDLSAVKNKALSFIT